jgi:hypothetical protein
MGVGMGEYRKTQYQGRTEEKKERLNLVCKRSGGANSQTYLNLYHFYCLIHISAFVTSHYQAIKIYKACPSESGTDKFMQRFI